MDPSRARPRQSGLSAGRRFTTPIVLPPAPRVTRAVVEEDDGGEDEEDEEDD